MDTFELYKLSKEITDLDHYYDGDASDKTSKSDEIEKLTKSTYKLRGNNGSNEVYIIGDKVVFRKVEKKFNGNYLIKLREAPLSELPNIIKRYKDRERYYFSNEKN